MLNAGSIPLLFNICAVTVEMNICISEWHHCLVAFRWYALAPGWALVYIWWPEKMSNCRFYHCLLSQPPDPPCLLLEPRIVHWLVFQCGLGDSVSKIDGHFFFSLCTRLWKSMQHQTFCLIWVILLKSRCRISIVGLFLFFFANQSF